ncbi:TolB family protein [Plantactinospora solaniradicis]|uniref:TolB family protein n=1 Tax=Plantactinospora solaniradicis TaxID=1723736 RepID=A0ABW1K6H0_9ACTN
MHRLPALPHADRSCRRAIAAICAGLAVGTAGPPAGMAQAAESGTRTSRASVATAGTQANSYSLGHAISSDGRYVAFDSAASNLVPRDTNGASDVFLRDRERATTIRVGVSRDGGQANGNSAEPTISPNGRYIGFTSIASNLVPGDSNEVEDVFLKDVGTGAVSAVTVSGVNGPANGSSFGPAVSADGRYVTFSSYASNLVPGDTNSAPDVFVRDLRAGVTTRASVSDAGEQADDGSYEPAIDADGRYVTFSSSASNLVPGDTNSAPDVFVRDLRAGVTIRVSVSDTEEQANGWGSYGPAISADGRRIVFTSNGSNLTVNDTNGVIDVFVRDLRAGTTRLVTVSSAGAPSNTSAWNPVISADGRYVSFATDATNLVADDTNDTEDVFVRDLWTGVTSRVSVSGAGAQADAPAHGPAISGDGRHVSFISRATNLVPGDTNDELDVFVRHQ